MKKIISLLMALLLLLSVSSAAFAKDTPVLFFTTDITDELFQTIEENHLDVSENAAIRLTIASCLLMDSTELDKTVVERFGNGLQSGYLLIDGGTYTAFYEDDGDYLLIMYNSASKSTSAIFTLMEKPELDLEEIVEALNDSKPTMKCWKLDGDMLPKK